MKKVGIRRQILRALVGNSVITLLVAGGIILFGIIQMKSNTDVVATNIGKTATEISNEVLKNEILNSLQTLVHERTDKIAVILDDLIWCVTALAEQTTMILKNPQDYKPRRLYLPGMSDDVESYDKTLPKIRYPPEVNWDDVAEEVALTANIQDLQRILINIDDMYSPETASVYLVSESGFAIDLDKNGNTRYSPILPLDFRKRPWYIQAVKEKKAVLSGLLLDTDVTDFGLVLGFAAPYYNAKGEIAGVAGIDSSAVEIIRIVNETKIGDNGYSFVLNNKTGQVLFSPKIHEGTLALDFDMNMENDPSIFDSENKELAAIARKMAARETGISFVNVDGASYYLAYAPIEGIDWSLGSLIEEAILTTPAKVSENLIADSTERFVLVLNNTIKWIIISIVISFVLIVLLVQFLAHRVANKLTQPLHELTEGVREIASGNLDEKLDIHTGDEIEHLAVCFNSMTDELKDHIANLEQISAYKERVATELDIATSIQLSMLSRDFNLRRDDVEIYSTMEPAKEVGGYFYDFYMIDDKHLVVTIADVSGKGISAALFMAMSEITLYDVATMSNPDCLSEVIASANNRLYRHNKQMMFVTVFMAMINLETGKMIYVNGGHNPPLIYRQEEDQMFHYLEVEDNCVLGLMEEVEFVQQETQLKPGDVIYFYTDGVTEAMNEELEQYNEQRLENCLNSADKKCDLRKLLAFVKNSVLEHVGNAEQSDDMTMLAVRLTI